MSAQPLTVPSGETADIGTLTGDIHVRGHAYIGRVSNGHTIFVEGGVVSVGQLVSGIVHVSGGEATVNAVGPDGNVDVHRGIVKVTDVMRGGGALLLGGELHVTNVYGEVIARRDGELNVGKVGGYVHLRPGCTANLTEIGAHGQVVVSGGKVTVEKIGGEVIVEKFGGDEADMYVHGKISVTDGKVTVMKVDGGGQVVVDGGKVDVHEVDAHGVVSVCDGTVSVENINGDTARLGYVDVYDGDVTVTAVRAGGLVRVFGGKVKASGRMDRVRTFGDGPVTIEMPPSPVGPLGPFGGYGAEHPG